MSEGKQREIQKYKELLKKYDVEYVILYNFESGHPCPETVEVLRMLINIPSWQQGLASQKLIEAATNAWRLCIDLHLFLNPQIKSFNPFNTEIDLSKVLLSKEFDYVVGLIPNSYRHLFPKIINEMPPAMAFIPKGARKYVRRQWDVLLEKYPTWLWELYQTKTQKEAG